MVDGVVNATADVLKSAALGALSGAIDAGAKAAGLGSKETSKSASKSAGSPAKPKPSNQNIKTRKNK